MRLESFVLETFLLTIHGEGSARARGPPSWAFNQGSSPPNRGSRRTYLEVSGAVVAHYETPYSYTYIILM